MRKPNAALLTAPVAVALLLGLVISTVGIPAIQAARPGAPHSDLAAAPPQANAVPLLYSSAPDYLDAGLQNILDNALDGVPGNWAVSVKKLDTGQYAAVNGRTQTVTASLYKLFVFYAVMRQRKLGTLSLDDTVTITDADAAYDVSIGQLNWNIGDQVKISTLIDRMITVSDNTAAVALVYYIGADTVNDSLQRLGLTNTSINFSGGDNLTTAAEYSRLLELIATDQVLDRDSCYYMIQVLLGQQLNDLLPAGLPNGTPIAHKTGTLDNMLHDAGIVYGPTGPYVITLLSWNLDDYSTAQNLMPQLSRAVYHYFNGHVAAAPRYFPETHQVVGPAFLLFYNSNGGNDTFGLPIGPETTQGDRVVQYFERARLQRPAAGGAVVPGPIGRELAAALGLHFDPTAPADPNDPDTQWFPATKQAIGQPFLTYWRERGAQDLFGLPISNIVVEQHDGQTVRVQYFERARFELLNGKVQLGTIGSELYARQH